MLGYVHAHATVSVGRMHIAVLIRLAGAHMYVGMCACTCSRLSGVHAHSEDLIRLAGVHAYMCMTACTCGSGGGAHAAAWPDPAGLYA